MFGFDDAISGAVQLTNQTIGQTLGSSLGYFFGGKSEKRSNKRSEAMTARQMDLSHRWDKVMADYMAGLQYGYNKQAFDYSNQEQYRLARQFAENSAKWQVQGLRNAGLNPILAATDGNFRGTFGDIGQMAGSSASGSSGGSSQFRSAGSSFSVPQGVNLARALSDFSNAKQTVLDTDIKDATKGDLISQQHNTALKSSYDVNTAKEQAGLVASQAALNLADAEKTKAVARQMDSNTALNLIRAENEKDTGGVSTKYGFISSLLRAFMPDFRDSNTARRHITEQIKDATKPSPPPPLSIDPHYDVRPFVPSNPRPWPPRSSLKPDEKRFHHHSSIFVR